MIWLLCPVQPWRLSFIRTEPPCWKGEIQIGPLVLGWQRAGEEGKSRADA